MKTILSVLILIFLIFNFGCLSNDTEKYIEDLKSENIMVRKNALYYLGKKKEKTAVPMLIEFLKDDQPKETKLSAIEALGKICDSRSIDVLIGVLMEKDNDIRIAAVEALGKIRNPKAVKPLLNILNNKNNKDIRLTAIWALGNIGDNRAIPALTKLLGDQDNYVRYNAAQSLKKIGSGK